MSKMSDYKKFLRKVFKDRDLQVDADQLKISLTELQAMIDAEYPISAARAMVIATMTGADAKYILTMQTEANLEEEGYKASPPTKQSVASSSTASPLPAHGCMHRRVERSDDIIRG